MRSWMLPQWTKLCSETDYQLLVSFDTALVGAGAALQLDSWVGLDGDSDCLDYISC